MRPRDRDLAQRLEANLNAFDHTVRPLRGIRDRVNREVFIEQVLDSIHRVAFVGVLRTRRLSELRADPRSGLFDPLKAAILYQRKGNIDDAFWMVFLFVHFGKNAHAGWRYAREVYGRLGDGGRWDWARVSTDVSGFRAWLHSHQVDLRRDGVPRGFGNHRKYESLDAYSPRGTGAAVKSYVRWVRPPRTHQQLMAQACQNAEDDPRKAFGELYQSMQSVARFGRTARFDYLAMIGKLGLADIEPDSAYLQGSTGPIRGARLLFGGRGTAATLDGSLIELDKQLGVGMQVLEDSLCNWQKSPAKYVPFRG